MPEISPITFDLTGLHLGDVLLAMPAMRAGDSVIARPSHRVPGLEVNWLDSGRGIRNRFEHGVHITDGWLSVSGREPVRHKLLPNVERDLLVIAPSVKAKSKQWSGWAYLRSRLPRAAWIGDSEPRGVWMETLNRAHTVICPDTGTVHMADALGVPKVIGLYGGGLRQFGPYWTRGAHCIEREGMAMTVNEVMAVVNG